MKAVKIFYLFIIISVFGSCKKFLDKVPDTANAYPTTVQNIQALLDDDVVMNYDTPSFSESSADDYYLDSTTYNSIDDYYRTTYIWQNSLYTFPEDWTSCYSAILNTNIGISQIDKIPYSNSDVLAWKNVKGSSYFYRAYYFLNLAWVFSKAYDASTADTDLGIVLRNTTDINVPSVRATVRQTYQQIIDDAKQAVIYLPDLPAHPLRPSKTAAYALLARTYLSMRDYDNALMYSDLCLQIKSDLIDFNGDPDLVGPFNQSLPPFRIFNHETIFYSESAVKFRIVNSVTAYIDTTLYSSYAADDLRKSAFFSGNYPTLRFKGTYSQTGLKFFSGIAVDEVLLMKAECLARKGNKDAALAALNTLLIKRKIASSFIPTTANTAAEALTKILLERRKELLMRNLRWMDIKRLNKEGANITLRRNVNGQDYTLAPNNDRFALALPIDIIQITGMPQNPGW